METTTAKLPNQMNPLEFTSWAHDEAQDLCNMIPNVFWNQNKLTLPNGQPIPHFQIGAELFRGGFVRIPLSDPKFAGMDDQGKPIMFYKMRLQAIMTPEYKLQAMVSGATGVDTPWLPGYRSMAVRFSMQEVQDGWISQIGYDSLLTHLQWAEELKEQYGEKAYNETGNASIRPYLTLKDGATGSFYFSLEPRPNRSEKDGAPERVLGIVPRGWTTEGSPFHIVGRLTPTDSVGGDSNSVILEPSKMAIVTQPIDEDVVLGSAPVTAPPAAKGRGRAPVATGAKTLTNFRRPS